MKSIRKMKSGPKKALQKGFTLIELMIVIAIIAILAAIAIPQYENYIVRSQFSESQTIAQGMEMGIQMYVGQNGTCPTNTTAGSGLMPDTSYVGKYVATAEAGGTAAATGGCTITVTFKPTGSVSNALGGKTVTFTAKNSGGTYSWVCSSAIANKYMPSSCRSS